MNVCVLTDTWYPVWGGGQEHILQIARHLAHEKNISIDILTQNLLDSEGKMYPQSENLGDNIRVVRIGRPHFFGKPWQRFPWWIEAVVTLQKLHRKNHYDLLHAHAYTAAIPAKAASLIWQVPLIFTVHGMLNKEQSSSFSGWFERILFTKIRYDGLITVSQDFLKEPNVNQNVCYIPNGVSQHKMLRKIRKFQNRTLLFVGRLEEQKRVSLLLKALPYIQSKIPDVKLICIGSGSQFSSLRKLAKDLKIKNQVQFLGNLPRARLAHYYQKSHLFVLPSRGEGFPLVLLEAWSYACPVLAVGVGELKYLIKNQKNGFLTNASQPKSLAEEIINILHNPNLVSIGKTGQRMSKKYTWESSASQHWRFYKQIIAVWKNRL